MKIQRVNLEAWLAMAFRSVKERDQLYGQGFESGHQQALRETLIAIRLGEEIRIEN